MENAIDGREVRLIQHAGCMPIPLNDTYWHNYTCSITEGRSGIYVRVA